MAYVAHARTHGAERGLNRFEGFSEAVFAIALTLLIFEIKVPGCPDGYKPGQEPDPEEKSNE